MATKALVVAISKYATAANNLPGVLNDVPVIMRVLSAYGFNDVEVLRDQNATSDNIRTAMNQLVDGTSAGDTCVFYFSGHGIQLPAGFTGSGDADGRDEAFVPYEATSSSLILDNWMAQFLKFRLPQNVSFWGLYDCCNSGELFKAALIAGLEPVEKVKSIAFEQLTIDGLPQQLASSRSSKNGEELKSLILDGTLSSSFHFGAARKDDSALCLNIDGASRSVFTWAMGIALTGSPKLTAAQFEQAVASKVAEKTAKQVPQLACAVGNENRLILT